MPKLRLSPLLVVMNIALVVYGLSALLSLVSAYDSSLSGPTIVAVLSSILIYFVLVNRLNSPNVATLFAMSVGVLGLIFCLFFISQFAHADYPETPDIINRVGRITTLLPDLGIFIHQNSAATVIELLLPIVLALPLMTTSRNQRVFWVITVLVLVYALVLSYSRGSFAGLAVAFLLGLAAVGIRRLSVRQAVALIVGILVVVAFFIAGLVIVGPRVPFIASLIGVAGSRFEIFRNSLGLAGDYIFTGIGMGGTFGIVYSRFSLMIFVPEYTYTHNLYLEILLGQGIFGFVAFMVAIIAFYLFVLRVMLVVKIAEVEPLFYGAWIGVTATLLHGLTDARQYVESPFNLPLLFIGMALTVACGANALRAEAFENRATNKGGGWRTLTAITVGIVVLLVIGFVMFNKPVLAAWHTNLGALDETRADGTIQPNLFPDERNAYLKNAHYQYEQALEIDPDYPNANRRLGNMDVAEGSYEAAIPLLEKAYSTESGYPASIKGLGLAYTWVGRTHEAACILEDLPNVDAMEGELYSWDGSQHDLKQDLLAAYALETAAIVGNYQQTIMDVWILTGDRFVAAGKPERAQEWYSRVLDKDKDNTAAIDRLKALGLEKVSVTTETGCK